MIVTGPVGVWITVGVGMPAVAVQSPVMVGSVARLGTGSVTSFTVTVKLVLAPSGLLVQVTRVSPPGKKEPDG
jgi:hypothetical protein